MSWFRELFLSDHGFAVWRDTTEHRSRSAGTTAEHSMKPSLRPTVFRTGAGTGRGEIPQGSLLCDSWPPDDVIIRARSVLEAESRFGSGRPPVRQVAPAVVLLGLAVAALAIQRQVTDAPESRAAAAASAAAGAPAAATQIAATPVLRSWHYEGPEHVTVRHLLARVGGWSLPACDSCSVMATPRVQVAQRCPRDGVVASAIQYAWAAEAHAAVGRQAQATAAAQSMRRELEIATSACAAHRRSSTAGACTTTSLWPCPAA